MKHPNRLHILTSLALAGGAPLVVFVEEAATPVAAPEGAVADAPVSRPNDQRAKPELAAMHAVYRAGLERGGAS